MRIQHNISAINAHRQFGNNNAGVSGNLEKLSSGYRINKAGDDAAGLAISEKMRAQIKGLDTAQKNAQDGISLVQTAEGALTEVHSMLNRMTELATQSANGTYQDKTDRENLQKEITSLKTEIDRIADSTNYNGIQLLDGTQAGGSTSAGAVSGSAIPTTAIANVAATAAEFSFTNTGAVAAGKTGSIDISYTDASGANKTLNIQLKGASAANGTFSFSLDGGNTWKTTTATAAASTGALAAGEVAKGLAEALKETELADTFTITEGTAKLTFKAKEAGASKFSLGAVKITPDISATGSSAINIDEDKRGTDAFQTLDMTDTDIKRYDGTNAKDAIFEINGKKFAIVDAGKSVTGLDPDVNYIIASTTAAMTAADTKALSDLINQKTGLATEPGSTAGAAAANGTAILLHGASGGGSGSGGGLTLQIGDTSDTFNKVTVSIGDMHASSLGIGDIDIGTEAGASAAMSKIKDAINKVSSTRGDLGALQNRLDHTINNLGVASENMSAAESRIRDVDMAKEMMDFTKNNILTQASQAMLAQANQLPQGVLQLLQ